MKQHIVAQKVLFELEILGLSNEKVEDVLWEYLKMVYAAGYDEGRLQRTKRRAVIQMDMQGKPIKIWDCAKTAARHLDMNESTIRKAALGKINSGKTAGFKWKFVDDGKNNDSSKSD